MSDLFWLTEEQIERLRPFFPRSHGKPRVDDRRVLSGIVFVNRNELRWRDAPSAYGPHKTLYALRKDAGQQGASQQYRARQSRSGTRFEQHAHRPGDPGKRRSHFGGADLSNTELRRPFGASLWPTEFIR